MVRFTTKKIESLTLGEKLRKVREEKRLTLPELSKITQIQVKYLKCLEDGDYKCLPADVYVRGFLRSLAVATGTDEKNVIRQYEREKDIQKNIKKIEEPVGPQRPLKISNFVFTPRLLFGIFGAMALLAGFFFLYREVNEFVSTPRLSVLRPVDSSNVDGNTVQVVGIAEKDARVFINEQPVIANEKGEFSETISLTQGFNLIEIKVRNKFDKETFQKIGINANYEQLSSANAMEDKGETLATGADETAFEFEVSVLAPTWMSIEADGSLVYSGVLNPGEIEKVKASERIILSSAKGNATFVKLDGKDLGMASKDAGLVKDLEFNKKGMVPKEKTN